MRGQDRHTDAQRAEGDRRHAHARLRRSHVLGMAALASSDGGQDPVDAAIRPAASQDRRLRPAETGQVRAFRFRHQDVRGHCCGSERRHDARREGSLCRSRGPHAAIARCGHDGEPTGGAGLPGAGCRGGAAAGDEARGNHRSERSASSGFGGAHRGVARAWASAPSW